MSEKTPVLWDLLGIYFNQDWSSDYGSETASIDAFLAEDPDAPRVVDEIAWVLENHSTEQDLDAYLVTLGNEYIPPAALGGYRGWLTRIADRVRAATG
jgi:CdiI immunity protein